jgi:hypothetical protein
VEEGGLLARLDRPQESESPSNLDAHEEAAIGTFILENYILPGVLLTNETLPEIATQAYLEKEKRLFIRCSYLSRPPTSCHNLIELLLVP